MKLTDLPPLSPRHIRTDLRRYGAVQGPDGRWWYSCTNQAGTFATGACSAFTRCEGVHCQNGSVYSGGSRTECPLCEGKGFYPADPPCPGHDTADEATEHYMVTLKVHEAILHVDLPPFPCAVTGCKRFTTRMLVQDVFPYYQAWLCDGHRDRPTLFEVGRKR